MINKKGDFKMAKLAKKGKGLWQEFKEFINKGNAFMLAVGVVIGGAFSAIVTAFVNMLMSIATWPVPGGLKGLVTVLPPFPGSVAQAGMDPNLTVTLADGKVIKLGQSFNMSNLHDLAKALAIKTYDAATVEANPNLIESVKATILSKYTLHGTLYTYNMSAVIDWGAIITAVISFIIIALVLFIIVKIVSSAAAKKAEIEAKMQEEYYKKHPEERPVEPEPGEPEPTEVELLKEIRDALVEKKEKPQEE